MEFSCHQVRNILDPNHVSGGIHSGLHFEKAFNRDRFLKGLTPKYQVLESRPLTYNEEKNESVSKTDQRSSKSDKKLGSVGQNSPTPNLEFS